MSPKPSTILVIGGTSDLGLAVAHLAAEPGARLALVGRDAEKLRGVVDAFAAEGHEVRGSALDAADTAALNRFLDTAGPTDHVVSTVGGAMGGGFLANGEEVRRTVEGKFFAALRIARTVATHLRDGGSITLTAGSGGRPHNASGAIVGNTAIRMLVEGLAVELAPRLRVNAIAPTWMDTALWRDLPREQVDETRRHFEQTIPLRRISDPREVAGAYLFAMQNTFITGQTVVVDGGLGLVS